MSQAAHFFPLDVSDLRHACRAHTDQSSTTNKQSVDQLMVPFTAQFGEDF